MSGWDDFPRHLANRALEHEKSSVCEYDAAAGKSRVESRFAIKVTGHLCDR